MCLFDSIDLEKEAKCKSATRGQDNTECTLKPFTWDGDRQLLVLTGGDLQILK